MIVLTKQQMSCLKRNVSMLLKIPVSFQNKKSSTYLYSLLLHKTILWCEKRRNISKVATPMVSVVKASVV